MAGRTIKLTYGVLFCVSGISYLYFLVLANTLDEHEFQGFTYAAAVVGLAAAIAEAGILYVAPPLLRARVSNRAARVAGAFVAISYGLLCVALLFLAGLMGVLRPGNLTGPWLMVSLAIMAPNIALQAWVLVRLKFGLAVLGLVTALRGVGLLAVSDLETFLKLVVATSAVSIFLVLTFARVGNALRWPRWREVRLCLQRLRSFVALRAATVFATAGVPFFLGLVQGPAAVAWYMIGDRTRVIFSSMFQPLVHALYLSVCRKDARQGFVGRLLSVPLIVTLLVVSTVIGALLAGWLNNTLYASKYPNSSMLALFVVTGHVTALSSIAYLVKLIPQGLGSHFIRGGLLAPIVLIGMLAFTRADPIRVPAMAVLTTELFLCAYVWGAWWRRGRATMREPAEG
jgi:hypothetical protein